MTRYIAAIDQGTTSSRCMLFDAAGAELFNTQFSLDRNLEEMGELRALARQALATGQRQVSDVSPRLRAKGFAVTTALPVQTASGVRYVVAMRFGAVCWLPAMPQNGTNGN